MAFKPKNTPVNNEQHHISEIKIFDEIESKIDDINTKHEEHFEKQSNVIVNRNSVLKSYLFYFSKGVMLNVANPGCWIYWILWVGVITASYTTDGVVDNFTTIIFFSCVLLTSLAMDTLKAFAASRLKGFITVKFMKRLNHIFGLILVGFGVFLLGKTIWTMCV
jgi:threonine/homoserine/homoserine lactone efflux protein